MNIEIIFEDNDILVINKPTGLVVHPDGKTEEPSVSEWFGNKYPDSADVGEPIVLKDGGEIKRPGIVHRLDRDTSGVMVLAKTQESFLELKEQFKERGVKKIYNAFVYGEMKEDDGVVDREIGRSSKDFRLWSAQRGARGKMREAVTEYTVLGKASGFSFVEFRPQTGRTHQIRVHAKAINYPIVCDSLYAPKRPCELGFKRTALHALQIELSHKGGKVTYNAPLPEDFMSAKSELGL